MTEFRGSTPVDLPPILGASFWQKGSKVVGVVLGTFETENGICYTLKVKPFRVSGRLMKPPVEGMHEVDRAAIGNMKGFMAAVSESGAGELKIGDAVVIECTGEKDTGQASPMLTFNVTVNREDAKKF